MPMGLPRQPGAASIGIDSVKSVLLWTLWLLVIVCSILLVDIQQDVLGMGAPCFVLDWELYYVQN